MEFTSPGGQVGMSCAIAAFWALGQLACAWSERLARGLVIGAALVGSFQVIPILQIYAGATALQFWLRSGFPVPPLSEWDGFIVTAITGGELLTAAGICGLAIVLFLPAEMTSQDPKTNAAREVEVTEEQGDDA
jgi:hypothetical protein